MHECLAFAMCIGLLAAFLAIGMDLAMGAPPIGGEAVWARAALESNPAQAAAANKEKSFFMSISPLVNTDATKITASRSLV
jgi:hypothetical protein